MKLATKQLRLEKVRKEHLPQIFEIWSDSEAGKYMVDSDWGSAEELNVILEEQDDDYYSFAAFEHDGDEVVATCRISLEDGGWDIGFNVRKTHWGKGFATEMVQALIGFGRELGADAICSSAAKANGASCRVLEKCGFEIVGESSFVKKSLDIIWVRNDYRIKI